jgi:hypothetical protein
VIHILEEALLGENFVDKIKRLYWKGYSWKRFFWYNTGLIILNVAAILFYENRGGGTILFPLILASERCLNGLYHVWESIRFNTFSSGLLTSVLFWILAYFFFSEIFHFKRRNILILRYYFTFNRITACGCSYIGARSKMSQQRQE